MKHKNLKKLIIPMIIITILTSIMISIQTYYQYRKITITLNEKVSEIMGMIKQNYPDRKSVV